VQMSEQLIVSGGVSVVVIDSVSALMPESEMDREYGDPQVGSQARLLSTGLRRLTKVAGQYNVTLIFINQLRMKIGTIYGNPEVCCDDSRPDSRLIKG
jgi:recombination protein RecA